MATREGTEQPHACCDRLYPTSKTPANCKGHQREDTGHRQLDKRRRPVDAGDRCDSGCRTPPDDHLEVFLTDVEQRLEHPQRERHPHQSGRQRGHWFGSVQDHGGGSAQCSAEANTGGVQSLTEAKPCAVEPATAQHGGNDQCRSSGNHVGVDKAEERRARSVGAPHPDVFEGVADPDAHQGQERGQRPPGPHRVPGVHVSRIPRPTHESLAQRRTTPLSSRVMTEPLSGPVPISARLALSDEALARLKAAPTRAEKKVALQAAHDEIAATLVPRLTALRDSGQILDFATSWILAEAVVHVRSNDAAEVRQVLAGFPELRDVTGDERVARTRLRKLF